MAPPRAGTRLSREDIWEQTWQTFHPGNHFYVTRAHTLFVLPAVAVETRWSYGELKKAGWRQFNIQDRFGVMNEILPHVREAFGGGNSPADLHHYEIEISADDALGTERVFATVYPSNVVLFWIIVRQNNPGPNFNLFALSRKQADLVAGKVLSELEPIKEAISQFELLGSKRWLVFGQYDIDRHRSSLIDESRSVRGLLHAVAAGNPSLLSSLPSLGILDAATVDRPQEDVEFRFTTTGGARFCFSNADELKPSNEFDTDFLLFLMTVGQRYTLFELGKRMIHVERQIRNSRFRRFNPISRLRADVMLFTNALWFCRISDDPDIERRYETWAKIHGANELFDNIKIQVGELDQYWAERREKLMNVMISVFLPITLATSIFSGNQFSRTLTTNELVPGPSDAWLGFGIYALGFAALIVGVVLLSRVVFWWQK